MGDEEEQTTTVEKVRATIWCERWARKVRKQRPDLAVSTRLKGPHWRYNLTIVKDVDGEKRTLSVTSEPPFIQNMAESMLRHVDGPIPDLGEPGAWVKDDVTGEWRDALPGETPTMRVTNGEEQA